MLSRLLHRQSPLFRLAKCVTQANACSMSGRHVLNKAEKKSSPVRVPVFCWTSHKSRCMSFVGGVDREERETSSSSNLADTNTTDASTSDSSDAASSEIQCNKSGTLFMRGLPYSITKEEIIQFFGTAGVKPLKVLLRYDRSGFANGKAEVEFQTNDDVTKGLSKHNAYIGNRYIEISIDPFPIMNADRMPYRRRDDSGRRWQSNRNDSSSHIVKLGGLPYDATPEDVYKFFKPLAITPIGIELKYNDKGYSIGLCHVRFKTHAEALEALKNNDCYIGDRYIKVSLWQSAQSRYSGMFDEETAKY